MEFHSAPLADQNPTAVDSARGLGIRTDGHQLNHPTVPWLSQLHPLPPLQTRAHDLHRVSGPTKKPASLIIMPCLHSDRWARGLALVKPQAVLSPPAPGLPLPGLHLTLLTAAILAAGQTDHWLPTQSLHQLTTKPRSKYQ